MFPLEFMRKQELRAFLIQQSIPARTGNRCFLAGEEQVLLAGAIVARLARLGPMESRARKDCCGKTWFAPDKSTGISLSREEKELRRVKKDAMTEKILSRAGGVASSSPSSDIACTLWFR
jgi:hypothetical protein